MTTQKKLAREAQQQASEKEKQDWRLNNCWFDKKRKLLFGPNNIPLLPETLQSLHRHTLTHWSTDKIIAFMNTY